MILKELLFNKQSYVIQEVFDIGSKKNSEFNLQYPLRLLNHPLKFFQFYPREVGLMVFCVGIF